MALDTALSSLRQRAQQLASRAHVPFSEAPVAAVLLLADGTWVPGVRVESAAYSLTIPALLNAYTTAVAADRGSDLRAAVLSRPFRPEDEVYLQALDDGQSEVVAEDAWIRPDGATDGGLRAPHSPLPPALETSINSSTDGIQTARRIAERAYVPESGYAVGVVLELEDGRLVPGVNVEHPDWARILCAERDALGTLQSYALPAPRQLFLTCNEDPDGTPCGACRQLLAELAPSTTLWMDRHSTTPERTTVSTLLPGSFRGQALLDER